MVRFALLKSAPWSLSLLAALGTFGIASRPAKAQTQPAIVPTPPPQITLPSGAAPIFIGDFNGDGLPDLAYGNYFGGPLSIMLDFAGNPPTTVTSTLCPAAQSRGERPPGMGSNTASPAQHAVPQAAAPAAAST